MKIVTVRYEADSSAKNYLFETKRNIKKGEYVLVNNKGGTYTNVAIATRDSMDIRKEVLEYLEFNAPWKLPLEKVKGKMDLWEEEKKENE